MDLIEDWKFDALKGHDSKAQGNALGWWERVPFKP